MSVLKTTGLAAAALAALTLAACGGGRKDAGEVAMGAQLGGAQEVPPVNTPASGHARVWVDQKTNTATWTMNYEGLSSPVVAAHFHGPAAPGANAGVQIPIITKGPASSPVSGAANLTDQQETDLVAGRYYINIHTQANPTGEIRGQVLPGR
jgi:hypothetical protein